MARTHGAYAEYTAVVPGVRTEPLTHIPDGVTDEQAAALPIPAVTALGSLELLGVAAGQSIVVMGATGGVGGYAVQMARSRGAHVIATVRGDVEEARRLGAEEVYDTKSVDVVDAIHKSHPSGVDAVLDLVNGPARSTATPRFSNPEAGWYRRSTRPTKNGSLNATSRRRTLPGTPMRSQHRRG